MNNNVQDFNDTLTPLEDTQDQDSLTPVEPEESSAVTMSFPDAIREIIRGNKVRRVSWPSEEDYGLLREGWLEIFTNNGFHVWKVSDGDMEGNDWIIIK